MTILKKIVRFTSAKLFDEYLAVTNTFICGGLMASGDVMAQALERRLDRKNNREVHKQDWNRTARIGMIGLALGLPCHGWYVLLDRYLPGKTPQTILKKIFFDQIVFAPCLTSGFLIGSSLLEGKNMAASIDSVREKFLVMFLADCLVWPPAQYINFYILPPRYRVLYVNILAMFWDGVMSYLKHNDVHLPYISEQNNQKLD